MCRAEGRTLVARSRGPLRPGHEPAAAEGASQPYPMQTRPVKMNSRPVPVGPVIGVGPLIDCSDAALAPGIVMSPVEWRDAELRRAMLGRPL